MTTRPLAVRWNPLDWPLTHGPIPYAVLIAGWAALLLLAWSRHRRWRAPRLLGALLLGGALTAAVKLGVDGWWRPFPEGTPDFVMRWIAVALFAVALLCFRLPLLTRHRTRLLAVGGAVLVLLMSSSQVNRGFDQYPTARAMMTPDTPVLTTDRAADTLAATPGAPLEETWHAPPGLPAKGTLAVTSIPGHASGFRARPAYVYLPPAYQATPRPLLPVLVLLPGQPGGPEDWVNSGGIQGLMDDFAAAHRGLAPIVVVPDPIGAPFTNTLCMDSRIAKAQTYLAVDVPAWIDQHLQAAPGRTARAVGGISFGGTCALQLAVNAPQVYGSFLDYSGQQEPTLGSRQKTVKKAFDGDEAAFTAVDPLHLMARQKFPDTAGRFVVGAWDHEFRPMQEKVYAAAREAGMDVTQQAYPGWHGWAVWRQGLQQDLPWLAARTGLIR
ncbi:alpha/beta hydrolase [Kitasatospora sp. NPDC088391]|uniref:alpha/beta hydrolase n=1 Tax=Kitasatospora sp. NPDC088391 TaxID=3364074 RepID=UPI003828EA73